MVISANWMLTRWYYLDQVLKICVADCPVVNDYPCRPTSDTFTHFTEEGQWLDWITKPFAITPWKHFDVHLCLRPLAMQDTPRVVADNGVIICVIFWLGPSQLAWAVAIQKVRLFVFYDFPTKPSVIKITKFLMKPACYSSMLGCHETRVEIATHKLFYSTELNVLKQQISGVILVFLDHLRMKNAVALVKIHLTIGCTRFIKCRS